MVRATDGGARQSATTIDISVLDISKPPTFKQDEYAKTISENSQVGTSVIDIRAEYGDSSAMLNYIFIKGNSDNMFCINYLGVISVAQPLDREMVPSYELTVMVSLKGKNDTTVVKVTLRDANDRAPSFGKSIVVIDVPENQGLLKFLFFASRPGYKHRSNALANIRRNSECYDASFSTPSLLLPSQKMTAKKNSSHKNCKSNFNACNFSLYAGVNSNLKLLTATDGDNGENGRVTYSIVQTVMTYSKDVFAIDSSSGMVTLKKSLDREKASEHILFIKAQDHGVPPLSGK